MSATEARLARFAPVPDDHPPAPWRLDGPAIVVSALVPLERARAEVPRDVEVIPVLPGYTLGSLVAVTYEKGSTLHYSELIASAGLVRSGRRAGGWIAHIWVDSERSVSGGRSIWRLPKELAEFDLDRPDGEAGVQRFEARADGVTLARISAAAPRVRVSVPGLAPTISGGLGSHWFSAARGTMVAGPARVRVEIPAESPIAALRMRPSPVGYAGRSRLSMDSPAPIHA